MKRNRVWAFGWALFGLLALSGTLLYLGQREGIPQPSADSYNPSGSRALAELLRQSGYSVKVERSSKPVLQKSDLAIAFKVGMDEFTPQGASARQESPLRGRLREHLEGGGRVLLLHLPPRFDVASQYAFRNQHQVFRYTNESDAMDFSVSASEPFSENPAYDPLVEDEPGLGIAFDDANTEFVRLSNYQEGTICSVYDAIGLTNRFLDRADNAAFSLWLFRMLNPEKGRIVILEAMHSAPVDPGLLSMLGPWAVGGWWQTVLLFLVVVYTLGRRFGLPEQDHVDQRGGRELVDAYADVMVRAKMSRVALKKVVQSHDRDVRKRFGIAADLPPKRRNELIDPDLGASLSRAEIASEPGMLENTALREGYAVRLAQDLEDQVAKIKGEPARRKRSRRR